MYINKLWIKNQLINLVFFIGLIALVYFLLSKNECSLTTTAEGPVSTCQCKGYEVIFKNSLGQKGEKKSACLGYINNRYDLKSSNFYPTEEDCGLATNKLCKVRICNLNEVDRTLPKDCKAVGEGWVPLDNYLQ